MDTVSTTCDSGWVRQRCYRKVELREKWPIDRTSCQRTKPTWTIIEECLTRKRRLTKLRRPARGTKSFRYNCRSGPPWPPLQLHRRTTIQFKCRYPTTPPQLSQSARHPPFTQQERDSSHFELRSKGVPYLGGKMKRRLRLLYVLTFLAATLVNDSDPDQKLGFSF